jgi:hypothetical protein
VAGRNIILMVGPRCAEEAGKVFEAFDYPHKISSTDHSMTVPSVPFLALGSTPTEEVAVRMFEGRGDQYQRYERAEDVPAPWGFD